MPNARLTESSRYVAETIHQLKYSLYDGTNQLVESGKHIKILEDRADHYIVTPITFDGQDHEHIAIPDAVLQFALEGKS